MVPPTYLIGLLREARGAVRADVFTSASWVRRLAGESVFIGKGSNVSSWVPTDLLPTLYEQYDCLLSIGEIPGKQLSSKIFGYMASGKPIVHIYHSDNDANLPYLAGYPLALTLKDDEAALSGNTAMLCRFLLWSRGRKLDFPTVCELMRECTPEAVCAELIR